VYYKKPSEESQTTNFEEVGYVDTTGLDLVNVWLGQALASGAHSRRI